MSYLLKDIERLDDEPEETEGEGSGYRPRLRRDAYENWYGGRYLDELRDRFLEDEVGTTRTVECRTGSIGEIKKCWSIPFGYGLVRISLYARSITKVTSLLKRRLTPRLR